MSDSPDEASITLRPFEVLAFAPRSDEEANSGIVKEVDGHAALQSRLALHGIAGMSPDFAETLLFQFGLQREGARKVLVEIWQHAYKKLLFRDDHIDRGEDDYLNELQKALGLTKEEVRLARLEVPDVDSCAEESKRSPSS